MGRALPRVAGALLVAVTLLLRWPLTPRPTGSDSFEYFVQVASLRDAGAMEWLLHPAAYFGLYPGTSPSGHLVLTAAFEETTGLGFEGSALLLSLAISLLGVAGMWLLAGELGVSPAARWLAALSFAVAPRFFTFALWRLSLRYLMVVLLPLFLWALLRSQHRRYGRHPAPADHPRPLGPLSASGCARTGHRPRSTAAGVWHIGRRRDPGFRGATRVG